MITLKKNLVYTILRYVFGVGMLAFGIMKFLPAQEMPPMGEKAIALITAMMGSGYMIETVAVFEILVGLAFLFNRYVALATVVVFPITLNYMLFHIFLDMATIIPALIVFLFNIYFISKHWKAYQPMLK